MWFALLSFAGVFLNWKLNAVLRGVKAVWRSRHKERNWSFLVIRWSLEGTNTQIQYILRPFTLWHIYIEFLHLIFTLWFSVPEAVSLFNSWFWALGVSTFTGPWRKKKEKPPLLTVFQSHKFTSFGQFAPQFELDLIWVSTSWAFGAAECYCCSLKVECWPGCNPAHINTGTPKSAQHTPVYADKNCDDVNVCVLYWRLDAGIIICAFIAALIDAPFRSKNASNHSHAYYM